MIAGKTVLAVIPARGGSKGVPRKNIRLFAGKPLLAWTIEAARASNYIDRLIVSSDDAEIIAAAVACGCEAPFVRPAALARDDTPGIDPVLHAIREVPGYDYVVLLQPTSPLRTAQDIDHCLERCHGGRVPACVSVAEVEKSPFWMHTLDEQGYLHPLIDDERASWPRQLLPKVYALNGAVYVAESRWLQATGTFVTSETVSYVMPKERSLDIDTEADCAYFAYHLASRQKTLSEE